jgi:GTP-binding protein Era
MAGGADTDNLRKAAMVGVVGRTNAGKSTVVNQMVGEKVSIVSPVEQTTRNTIRGIVEDPRGQLVLLDTPGLHKAVGPLGKLLNGMARATSAGVDILLVVFDAAHEPQLEDEGWMRRVAKERPDKVVFALNKCDRSPFYETMFRDLWKEVAPEPQASDHEPRWVTCCGIRKGGCDMLMDALFDFADPGPALFPEDVVTDYPRKLAIADVVREKLIQRLRDEVPHEVGVAVKDLYEDRKRGWDVAVTIYVNRPSQKGIVIGPRGSLLKAVRQSAEPELSDMFGVKVRLELWVKVEPNWMKNGRLLAEMGYLGAER